MDPVAVGTAASLATESIDLLKSAMGVLPTDGGKHHVPRVERAKAYLRFQQAVHEASVWPGWLSVLEEFSATTRTPPAELLRDLAASRQATAELLTALSEIRMVGNPEPRRIAEEMVTLLVELMESRLRGVPESRLGFRIAKRLWKLGNPEKAKELITEHIPGLAARYEEVADQVDDDRRQAQTERFNECQLALGTYHKRFTLAARKDLGYGPRFWQRSTKFRTHHWQFWRLREPWPGGWPPRQAKEIIADARRERLTRPVSIAIESSGEQRAEADA